MKVVFLLALCWIQTCKAAPVPCCNSKNVGGVEYSLLREEDTSPYNCLSNCLYEKVEDPGRMYCFAAGNKKVVCKDAVGAATPAAPPASGPTSIPSTCDAYPSGHTMEIYSGPSDECSAIQLYSGFSDDGIALIIAKHNELRQKVASGSETNGSQPSASDMRKVHWDTELAVVAQRWADQCTFGHDGDRSKCDGTYVGQNAYYSGSSVMETRGTQTSLMAKVGGAVQAWYDEVTEYGFNTNNIKPFVFDYNAGHYTQVVWAETTEVGCGLSYYEEGGWFKSLVICNYAVGGNMQGGTMYTVGEGCTSCPAGTSCDAEYTALCD